VEGQGKIMGTATLQVPQGLPRFEIGALGALDAATSGETSVISRAGEALIRQLIEVVDKQLLEALCCRTVAEFIEVREKQWSDYIRASRALTDMIQILIPASAMDLLCAAAEGRIVEDLERSKNVLFGEGIAEQADFSMWIFHRMRAVAYQIGKSGPPRDSDLDLKLNCDFRLYSMWGRFHYDCVLTAMKFERRIPDGIQESIVDGMRAWVNASTLAEQALELRLSPVEESPEVELPWDEEDRELLDSSMRDLDAESASSKNL
jgi:hypothetical protein